MRAVIFDLDGVLVRTDQAHDKAWRALAVRLGIPFDGRAAARLRGVSRMEALDIVLEGCGRSFTPAEKEALAAEKNERYRALIAEMTPADVQNMPLPDFVENVTRLTKENDLSSFFTSVRKLAQNM